MAGRPSRRVPGRATTSCRPWLKEIADLMPSYMSCVSTGAADAARIRQKIRDVLYRNAGSAVWRDIAEACQEIDAAPAVGGSWRNSDECVVFGVQRSTCGGEAVCRSTRSGGL